MNTSGILLMAVLAAQHPVAGGGEPFSMMAPQDPSQWPYWVAGTLAGAVTVLFGVYVKTIRSHAEEVKLINKSAAEALEDRSKRQGAEFQADKATIVDLAGKLAGLVEKVTAGLDKNSDAIATSSTAHQVQSAAIASMREALTTNTAAVNAWREEHRR